MKSCTKELSPEVIQAVTHSAQVQDNGSSNWLTALTDDPTTLTLDSTVLEKPPTSQVDKTNLAQAQEQDSYRTSTILLEVWFMTHCSGNPCRIASNKAAATQMEEIGNWPR